MKPATALNALDALSQKDGLHIFYGTVGTWGPCSSRECNDKTTNYILSITSGPGKYFNLCPHHQGILFEKLLASHLEMVGKENPRSIGIQRPIFRRAAPATQVETPGERERERERESEIAEVPPDVRDWE